MRSENISWQDNFGSNVRLNQSLTEKAQEFEEQRRACFAEYFAKCLETGQITGESVFDIIGKDFSWAIKEYTNTCPKSERELSKQAEIQYETKFGLLVLDVERGLVSSPFLPKDHQAKLTRSETALLRELMLYPTIVHTNQALIEVLMTERGLHATDGNPLTIKTHVSRTRRKLGVGSDFPPDKKIIFRVGEGFSLVDNPK